MKGEHLVIGSGPSGLMAATALLAQGERVTMLDVGDELEPERRARIEALAAREPETWAPSEVAAIRGPEKLDPAGPKLAFGSSFPYARDLDAVLAQHGTRCLLSHARGGLSRVWGAAVLPSRAEDLVDWPVTLDELRPHYAAAAASLRVAGARDDLEGLFPFYEAPEPALRSSAQARRLLSRMGAHASSLRDGGLRFGQARLAVRGEDGARGCRYTGRCLTGCPYDAIWNAAAEVDALRARDGFRYVAGVEALRVASTADGARVEGRDRRGAAVRFEGRRVFVAAGSLGTPRLAIDSLGAYDRPCSLRFQPYFLLPLVGLDSPAKDEVPVDEERLHTLAQIFLELEDAALSAHTIHLQLYTFNDYMRERLHDVTRWLGPAGAPLRRALLGRLLAIQAYLHSSEAGAIGVLARPGPAGEPARLELRAPDMARPHRLMKRVARRLLRHARELGVLPMLPMLHAGSPGEGNHLGGIFPMRERPAELETDRHGSLPGLPNVHLVDASVLPSLPATTFTYTVMANAHRIATEVARIDRERESTR